MAKINRRLSHLFLLLLLASPLLAQTFRGGINGTITDSSDAVVPDAAVVATDTATGVSRNTRTTSAGDFLFQDLPLGSYSVEVSVPGFATTKLDKVTVSAGTTFTLPIKLTVSSTATTVEVEASGLSLDTTTVTQTTNISSQAVNDTPMNGRDFTQLISVAPGFGGYAANGFGSVNGSRANQVNWQIDGVDNNDLWHNIPAVNQGGVQGIAGTVLPLDSIDQYSQQTQSTAEAGRNPGGVVNVVTKSGTNQLHGSIYYFNRNEAFSANSPFANGLRKQKLRNENYGASFGGPLIKERLFYFFNYEKQQFIINTPASTVEPTTAFQADSIALLNQFGLSPTSVATASLAALYPSSILNCPKQNSDCDLSNPGKNYNYTSAAPFSGYSYNGVGKLDFTISPKHSLALRMFGGQGNQTAYVGTYDPYFFETAPIRVFNWSAVVNSAITQRLSNQVLLGVNFFNQFFYDANHNIDPVAFGFNTGAAQPQLSGAPGIKINGFDNLQHATPPSGRNDVTGQITDTASLIFGKHEFRFSGEFRRGYVNEFYHRKTRGNFSFPGTQGPYGYTASAGFASAPCQAAYGYTTPTAAQLAYVANLSTQQNAKQIFGLADFLLGCSKQAQIVRGNTEREVYVNNFSGSAGDAFQLTQHLNVNYGVRYDYLGPLHNGSKDLSVFRPDNPNANASGFVFLGQGIDSLFPKTFYDFSPRFGFAYQPSAVAGAVLRAGFGMFFDQPNLNPFLDNRPPNGGASGVESNPGGASPVLTFSNQNVVILPGAQLFQSGSSTGGFSISPNLRPSYTFNYNLNLEKTLGPKTIFTVGYVGAQARKLISNHDINQAGIGTSNLSSTGQNLTRPYGSRFPNLGTINEVASIGNSNYNSLQTTLKTNAYHGLSSQLSYTWAHSLDILSQYRNANITDSRNPRADYGNMDYDTRHALSAYLTYDLPNSAHLRQLTNGWQVNSLLSFHSGQPYTVYTGNDSSGTGEGEDRVNLVPGVSPYAGSSKSIVNGQVQWITAGAFSDYVATPASPSPFGNTRRNSLTAPGYGDVDLSLFKNNQFEVTGHKITTQLRAEMFNLVNRANLAPPDNYLSDGSSFGTISQTIGYYSGAPGIGPGEPFNTQFALKLIF